MGVFLQITLVIIKICPSLRLEFKRYDRMNDFRHFNTDNKMNIIYNTTLVY